MKCAAESPEFWVLATTVEALLMQLSSKFRSPAHHTRYLILVPEG